MSDAPRSFDELKDRIRHELRWPIRLGKAALVLALLHVLITMMQWLVK